MYQKERSTCFYLFPAVVLILVFIYFPVVVNFIYSLYRWSAFSPQKKYIGLQNYGRLFRDRVFFTALINNTLYATISIVFQVGLGLILAAVLEDKVIRNRQGFFRTMYFLPSVISMSVVGLLWQMLYNPNVGIVNALLGAIGLKGLSHDWLGESGTAIYAVIAVSQWQYTGYTMMLFLVAIQKIPADLYEAATIDGAGRTRVFLNVTVPQVRGMLLVNMTITVVGAFKVFDEVYIMTGGGPGRSTEVLGTYLYRSGFRNDEMGYATSIATIIFIITFILSLAQLKASRVDREELGDRV